MEIDDNLYYRILAWLDSSNENCKHASQIVSRFSISFSDAYEIWLDYKRMRNL